MPFIVVYDANPLVGNTQRDLLFQVALAGLVQAKFTERIVDETIAAIHKSRPNIAPEKLSRLRGLMLTAVPDSIVSGHEPLIEGLHLRDPDDRHVLAAAIESGAQLIVTKDKDFTVDALRPWNIEAKTPDDYMLDLIDISEKIVWGCLTAPRLSCRSSATSLVSQIAHGLAILRPRTTSRRAMPRRAVSSIR